MAHKGPRMGVFGGPGDILGGIWRPQGYPRGLPGGSLGPCGIPEDILGEPWEAVPLPGEGLASLPGPTRLLSTLTASQLRARSQGLSAAMEPRGLSRLVGPLD